MFGLGVWGLASGSLGRGWGAYASAMRWLEVESISERQFHENKAECFQIYSRGAGALASGSCGRDWGEYASTMPFPGVGSTPIFWLDVERQFHLGTEQNVTKFILF